MGVDITAISRVLGVTVEFEDFNAGQARNLPQRIAVVGQGRTTLNGTYSLDPKQITSAKEAGDTYGYGSPVHLAARQFFPVNGKGIGSVPVTIYPMDDDVAGVASTGSIDVTGAATDNGSGYVNIGGIRSENIAITSGDAADAIAAAIKAAIDAVLDMPVTTGVVAVGSLPLTSKWLGESANDILIDVSNLEAAGVTFAVTAMASGANNPDVTAPLAKFGNTWETQILNCLNYEDTTTLDAYETFNAGRWDTLTKRGCFVITGSHDNYTTVTAITDTAARKDDKFGCILPAPGAPELPWVIAARAIALDIGPTANNNPPQNYNKALTGISAGTDGSQFLYPSLDAAVKAGSSTTLIISDNIVLNDVITTYHPDGDPLPAYRYIVDLVKLQNIVFNIRVIFESEDWKGAPLLPDDTPTSNPTAKKPKDAKAALFVLADSLARAAIISDPEFTKANMTSAINGTNPKRLDITYPVKLSGNTEIIDALVKFGFFFGN
jgi:phage tail sheath gpL-like